MGLAQAWIPQHLCYLWMERHPGASERGLQHSRSLRNGSIFSSQEHSLSEDKHCVFLVLHLVLVYAWYFLLFVLHSG